MEVVLITKGEFNYKQPKCFDVTFDEKIENVTITSMATDLLKNEYVDSDYKEISSITFPLASVETINHSYAMYYDNLGNLTTPIDNTKYITRSRDGFGVLKVLFDINDTNPIMYFNTNGEKLCILSFLPIRTANMSFTVRAIDELPNAVWISVFGESFSTKVDVAKARRALLAESDPNDSLAYMEAQLDVLNEVVFSMYDTLTLDQQDSIKKVVPAFDEFRTLIGSHSVLTIKSEIKCLEELSTGKAKIRKVQSDYYTAKSSI